MQVSIIQRRLTGYRIPFFNALRARLVGEGVELRLLHGVGTDKEVSKCDAGVIEWAELLPTKYLIDQKLCWQPFINRVRQSDMVIITQENALLANHLALMRRPAPIMAFWGHGANLQGGQKSFKEYYKRWSTRRVDWYFAYTKMSVDIVRSTGFPRERITCVNNSIDVEGLKGDLETVTAEEVNRLRLELGIGSGPVGVFIGSLYEQKRLDFLIGAANELRRRVPGYSLVIVGAGPELDKIRKAAEENAWIHYLGVRKGRDKAVVLKLGDVFMNPGLVGLGIFDAFVSGVPLVTTDCGIHSPEIAYLSTDNGVMTNNKLEDYVDGCQQVLMDGNLKATLVKGCYRAAEEYTLSRMVDNFTGGVVKALKIFR